MREYLIMVYICILNVILAEVETAPPIVFCLARKHGHG